ncbi:MAG: nuclear transport factor 2 family protein [Solirubrobacteraceae bacterium]
MPTIDEQLHELQHSWTRAEIAADVSALDALAVDDFALVGPAGFALDKRQWLGRYRQRDLFTRSLSFKDTTTRAYADVAVTIGRLIQEAEYQGRSANGEFRATQLAVRDGSGWRLAGMHLSLVGRPPPSRSPMGSEGVAVVDAAKR